MGTLEIDKNTRQLFVHSNIILYGNAATQQLVDQCVDEIATMWNEPGGIVKLGTEVYTINFVIRGMLFSRISPDDIFNNRNPKNNYFRVEEFVKMEISYVDGLNCNTGYFKLDNLYPGSTTAAHEYGHTLGLDHPSDTDLRGKGVPGIMYPRGTLVDPPYQYNPQAKLGEPGDTMHPMHRRVSRQDIDKLKLGSFNLLKPDPVVIGSFSAVYHEQDISGKV